MKNTVFVAAATLLLATVGVVVPVQAQSTVPVQPAVQGAATGVQIPLESLWDGLSDPAVKTVFVTGNANQAWPDALAIAPVAGRAGAKIVTASQVAFSTKGSLYPNRKQVVVIGGAAAVPDSYLSENQAYTPNPMFRIWGQDRFETAAQVAGFYWQGGADTVILARGDNPVDSFAAGPAGAALNAPILLTEPGFLPQATIEALRKLKPAKVIVVGGKMAVKDTIAAQVQTITNAKVQRVGGSDRYETSVRIAQTLFPGVTTGYVDDGSANNYDCYGRGQYATTLGMSAIAGAKKQPLLLANGPNAYASTATNAGLTKFSYVNVAQAVASKGWGSKYRQSQFGDKEIVWLQAAYLRAQRGVRTLKSCPAGTKFQAINVGWGGNPPGDGSVWASLWDANNFLVSEKHINALCDPKSVTIVIKEETLIESHGSDFPVKYEPAAAPQTHDVGLAIVVGRCV